MQEYEIKVELPGGAEEQITVPEMTRLEELAKRYGERYDDPVVLALYCNKLKELNKKIDKSGTLAFFTMKHKDGRRAYRRSVTFLMQKAISNLWGEGMHICVRYSLGEGYYCEFPDKKLTQDMLLSLKTEMLRLVDLDLPIEKNSVPTYQAEEDFSKRGLVDKAQIMHYRRSSRVNIYNLDGVKDYFYGYMVPSTGYLQYFDLVAYEDGLVLLFPGKNSQVVEPLETSSKLHHTLKESRIWSRMLDVGTVGALNEAIIQGRASDVILTQEALMEEKIGNLAARIASDRSKKFIMIAGPSSSGKTTFSHRLSIQLAAKGMIPHPLGLDDYYIDRSKCPRDEDGKLDFECLEAIDVELFNHDMARLLAGEEIELPSFNFKTGMREYRGKKLKLGKEDVLVVEGIHGLNDKLSYSLPAESKFRIYISALTQLSIDEHNPLPTADGRLLRRIVRDARTRNTSAEDTIAMWSSVRRGEEKYIFPFQEHADVMFNSALVYELAVLKIYAEPLLFAIPQKSESYLEAKRLLKLLDYFLAMPTEGISQNSLMREFIGGSCFPV